MVWPGQREILFGESGVQARKNKTPPFGGASGSKFNAKFFSHFFWSHVGRSFFDNLFHLSGAKKFLLLCFKSCNLCVDFCNSVFHSATSAFCFFFSLIHCLQSIWLLHLYHTLIQNATSNKKILGYRQVVRHGTLTPVFAGSSPATPANYHKTLVLFCVK